MLDYSEINEHLSEHFSKPGLPGKPGFPDTPESLPKFPPKPKPFAKEPIKKIPSIPDFGPGTGSGSGSSSSEPETSPDPDPDPDPEPSPDPDPEPDISPDTSSDSSTGHSHNQGSNLGITDFVWKWPNVIFNTERSPSPPVHSPVVYQSNYIKEPKKQSDMKHLLYFIIGLMGVGLAIMLFRKNRR